METSAAEELSLAAAVSSASGATGASTGASATGGSDAADSLLSTSSRIFFNPSSTTASTSIDSGWDCVATRSGTDSSPSAGAFAPLASAGFATASSPAFASSG